MPLPGGATDKIGNRYENLWTIDRLLELIDKKADSIEIEFIGLNSLNEQATAIRLEPVGEEGEGVEFWLQRGDVREYHQVKRQNTKGRWTLADLESKQILTNFKEKLENNQANCYFISTDKAYQLEELAERARSSQSWLEFLNKFLDAKDKRESFCNLVTYWHQYQKQEIEQAIDDFKIGQLSHQQQAIIDVATDSYEKLKRIYVETISERQLRQKVIVRLKSLIESQSNDVPSHTNYETVVDILAGLALNSIHKTLEDSNIWKHLKERGYQPCNYGTNNHHVLIEIDKANELYLSPLEKQIVIAGQSIPRKEVEEALDLLLHTQDKKGVFLIGEAGVGKSGVMLQIAKKLNQDNIKFFVFRIDTLSPEVNPDDVGKKYGLPHSPASVLGNISKNQNRDWILIIDQLDAVSQVSGRNSHFFDCIDNLLEQTRQFSKVRVLVACRKFDLDNDSRIKNLIGDKGILETVEIKRLSSEQVKETVQILGLNVSKLQDKQIKLLSLPLHLGLLAEISQDATIRNLNFETANDLFDKFWEFKQTKLYGNERIKHLVQWNQVIDKICDNISTKLNQTLSISKYLLDDYLIDIRIMISENVLIQEQDQIKFFHESFFDYAFARRFIAREKLLLLFIREDEQHLFKRAQVRQILQFERSINFNQYLNDIEELLNSEDIRFHLKQLVISLLSSLENPTEKEWEIIHPFMKDNESTLFNSAWGILCQPQWFMLAKNLGVIEQWLRDENDFIIDNTVRLISFIASDLPDEIPPLIEPFIENSSQEWLNRFLWIAERIELYLEKSRKLLDLFLTLLDHGKLDTLGHIFQIIYSISEENSAWTCEIIGHYLNRRLELYLIQLLSLELNYIYCLKIHSSFLKKYAHPEIWLNPFNINSYGNNQGLIVDTFSAEIFVKSADQAPEDYVINVLPFMLSVIELTSIKDNEKPYQDNVWRYRICCKGHEINSAILEGMEIALSNLAKDNPEKFSSIVRQYLLPSDFETIQFLLIRAYTANGERFADEAAEYLYQCSARLQTGYIGGFSLDNTDIQVEHLATRELLKAITPYCSTGNLANLERILLDYQAECEKEYRYIKERGYPQLVLLDAIYPERRSKQVKERLQELKGKFPEYRQYKKSDFEFITSNNTSDYLIGSAIPKEATEKMDDEQWLKALSRTGELLSNLDEEAKENPYRFAKLLCQFPNNVNTAYFNSILRGISESKVDIDVETALEACRVCHQLPEKPCGSSIAQLFNKLAYLSWDKIGFDIISYYALHDRNPEQAWRPFQVINGDQSLADDIYTQGINSVRGRASQAIAELIFKDKERTVYFKDTLQTVVKDPSLAVRSCVAVALTAVLNGVA